MQKKITIYLLTTLLLIVVAAVEHKLNSMNKRLTELNALYPFSFSSTLDPRKIVTVADQALSEHIFGFHASINMQNGLNNALSKVNINSKQNEITIEVRSIKLSNGETLPPETICSSLKNNLLKGTSHSHLKSLLKTIECNGNIIKIVMHKIPTNIQALLSLPDFAIYTEETLPITPAHIPPSSGPYSLVKLEKHQAILKRNEYYPSELTANQIQTVNLNFYDATDLETLSQTFNTENQNLIYFTGENMTEKTMLTLKNKGYIVEQFPSEWLLHLGFQTTIAFEDRAIIASAIDRARTSIQQVSKFGQEAYTVPPSDRPFGFDKIAYEKFIEEKKLLRTTSKLSKKITVGTMDYWSKTPIFAKTIESLKLEFGSQIEFVVLERKNFLKLYEPDINVYISLQGISAADPAHHLNFFLKFDPVFKEAINLDMVTNLSSMTEANAFTNEARALESKLIQNRVIVPIIHLPGFVASSPRLRRDHKLSGNWGIQTWTYQVN